MIGYLAITLLLAGVTPGILGDIEAVMTQSTFRCHRYFDLADVFRRCRNVSYTANIEVDALYQAVTDLCRDEAVIRSCVTDNVQQCENLDEIRAALDTTFQFCKPDGVPFPMEIFLNAHLGTVITLECLTWITVEAKNTCTPWEAPDLPYMATLEQQVKRLSSRYKWYVDCFITKNMTNIIPECNDMFRGNVYGIMISSLQMLANFGFDYNEYFEFFIQEA